MNRYVIPICDLGETSVWNEVVLANSYSDCKEKLMESLSEDYEIPECNSYGEFYNLAFREYNILIGDITDIEEL